MKNIFLVVFITLNVMSGLAQNPSFNWVKTTGESSDERPASIANDLQGNIFVTGVYRGGDLDPGPATYSASLMGGYGDLFISKFDPSGNLVWSKIIGGSSDDMGYSITVDDSGYVYTSGAVSYGSDFDTGPGTYTVSGGGFVSKMDNNGNLIWAKSIIGANITYGDKSLVVDKGGNVYHSGNFKNTVDFNPGAGVFNMTGYGSYSAIYVTKLNSQGNFVWAKKIAGSSGEVKNPSLTMDSTNNIYLSGVCSNTIDCDPGPMTYTLSLGMFISKLDSAGSFVWAKGLYSSQSGMCLSSNGEIEAKSIKADALGNIYLLGNFHHDVDFDPGPGTYTLTAPSSGTRAIFIMKLNTMGDFVWAKTMSTWGECNTGESMALDKFGYLYISGIFITMDFDPGPGNNIIVSQPSSAENAFIAKYDTTGNFSWARSIGGGTSYGYGITVDAVSNVYTTGTFYGTTMDFDPGTGSVNIASHGGMDIFIQKMNDCSLPMNPTNTTTLLNKTVCFNNINTLTVTGSGMINWFASSTGTNVIAGGNAFSPPLMGPGTYTYYVSATTCGTSISRTAITYTVNALPNMTISSTGSICIGSSSTLSVNGADTYAWNTGAITQSLSVTPITSSIYSVTGTDLNSCSTTQTVSITVDPTCADVWPGDANSDGTADNLDILELGLHYIQTGPARATTSNSWQSYFSNNWSGTITNGKNLNHSDCNGDGTINDDDTLAIFNNYGLAHAFKGNQQIVTNPQLSIVPDQAAVVKGSWGTASVYLGETATPVNNINGLAFTVNFDNTLLEANSIWIEYPVSFINASNQNLHFRKSDFGNNNLYTATTHTVTNNVSGNGLIAKLHYQIKSSLATDQVLNLGLVQANQSNASGVIFPLTSGTGTLMTMGSSVGLNELSNDNSISLSPNPAHSAVLISSTADLEHVEVINVAGQILISELMTEKTHRLNVENLANGVYFIKAYNSSKQIVLKKLVIQR